MKAGTIARGVAATMMAGAAIFALVCVITPHNVQLEALKGVPEMLSSASSSAASSTSSSSSSSAAKEPPTPVGGFVAVKKGKCLTPTDATQLKVDGVFGHHTTQDLQILINKNLPAQEPKKLPTEGIWCKETKRGLQVYMDANGALPLLKADGVFGPTTCTGMQNWLNIQGALPPLGLDGNCSVKTWSRMQQFINAQFCANQKNATQNLVITFSGDVASFGKAQKKALLDSVSTELGARATEVTVTSGSVIATVAVPPFAKPEKVAALIKKATGGKYQPVAGFTCKGVVAVAISSSSSSSSNSSCIEQFLLQARLFQNFQDLPICCDSSVAYYS